ncbi:DUF3732 domain-containing protein [Pectobacterium brasiliense]|uniref:DUF3732 domain-containing protein n=1 Tax=Pectobacterium brasiliense TaxID=180957 RepID=UPI0015DE82C9|nr:DUF3732 domain-containing protein [Pectobacterium brasiliense]MBA0215393.1 DUF3732 domain-containing protein [Pectobacterium brasiliense]
MKAIIKSINIFNNNGEHRFVELTDGVNVITGDSKTGKSALLEIVDYCLFSKTSSIPKGIITSFSDFYSIVFQLEKSYIVIGRPAFKTGKSSKAYIRQEVDLEKITPLTLDYFENITAVSLKEAQKKFEIYLGLSVSNLRDDENSIHHGKASIRNAVSLLFQHQNLIANKHALFYRFHDFLKRDRTIKELPIFLGWVDGNYYRLVRELDDTYKKLRTQEKLEKNSKITYEQKKKTIRNIIENYLAFIDYKLPDNINYSDLFKIAKDLPSVPDMSYGSAQTDKLYQEYLKDYDKYNIDLSSVNEKISKLESCSIISVEHATELNKIRKTFDISSPEILKCPLCASQQTELSSELKDLKIHQDSLVKDLSKLQFFHEDITTELENLIKQRDLIKKDLRILNGKIKTFEKNKSDLSKAKNFREKANFMRGHVSTLISVFLDNNEVINSDDPSKELKNRIKTLEENIAKYNLSEKYLKYEKRLNFIMTRICSQLDFEEELKPANLNFSLQSFDFYHKLGDQEIRLHEMGSGANWLACHLSLFLSILYILATEEKSCIPTFLFLDQPSQVYFPSGFNSKKEKDSDLKQVENIFNTIVSLLNHIKKTSGFMPQVIILEHADKLELKDVEFESLVRKRWKENGEKLI